MIGGAHTSTLADLEAARRDLRAAEGLSRFEMPEAPMLPLLGTWVVQIDTDSTEDVPNLRVWVNEALVSDHGHCADFGTG